MLLSRAATRRRDGRMRKLMFTDVKKAHLIPECKDDMYIELPDECEAPPGMSGKKNVQWDPRMTRAQDVTRLLSCLATSHQLAESSQSGCLGPGPGPGSGPESCLLPVWLLAWIDLGLACYRGEPN